MKKTKKILSIILAVMMILGAVPLTGMTAFAADTDFVIDENGILTAYNGAGGDVVIPDSVTSIGDEAFSYCFSLTSIVIPGSVTSIGSGAFSSCSALESVTIPENVTSIGDKAFYYCENLTSVKIPDGVTSIGDEAFSYCAKLESIEIPDGITSIGMGVFYSCINLESVTLSGSVTSIDEYAFCWCDSLTDVYFIGTEEQRNEMTIGSYNLTFKEAAIHFIAKHEHTFATEWTTDAAAHWHKCTAEDCDIEDYATSTVDGVAYGAHTWENGKCSVCDYECEHSFVNGVCEICGYEESVEPEGYSIFVYYDGLSDETASYGSVSHDIITEPYYVIPENPDTVKEDLNFNGFYCTNTGKMVQIGESVPLSDFMEKEDGYYLYLSARFSEKEKPGVTYTDISRYYVTVSAQYPDDPYAYLEDSDAGMLTFDGEFDKLDGQNVGTVAQPRQLMLYTRMGLNFMGYRSLLTGNVFETGDTIDVDKLPEAVYVGYELQEINENEGCRISLYEINDYVEPIFEYLGAVGGFLEPMYECTVNYYIPVEADENEGTTGDPLQFYSYAGSDVHTLAMLDLDTPMELTCQPDYMEDLGYVLDGYGALDDDEMTYPDGLIFMDQYSTNDNSGHLTYDVKLFYTEADEDANEEELLATAKEKISAKYQAILDDGSTSESVKNIATAILADIENADDRNEIKEICSNGEASIRLQEAKDMAIAELMTIAPEGTVTDEMQAVIDQAVAAIQASEDTDDFEDIITEARSEINRLLREAAEKPLGYVKEVTYTPSSDPHNTYTVKVEGRASMIQFYDSHAGTRSFDRNNSKVLEIKHYDADGNEVGELSRNLAYEVWTVYTLLEEDTFIVRAKGNGESKWEAVTDENKELYTFENKYDAPDAKFVSIVAPESGKKGAVMITATAEGADVERIMVKNADGSTVTGTVASGRMVDNGDGSFTAVLKGWASHDGVNTITVKLYAAGKWVEEQTVTYIVGNIER